MLMSGTTRLHCAFPCTTKDRFVKTHLFRGFVVAVCSFAGPVWPGPADSDRGRLLYENHCLGCHESQVHIRGNHMARSPHDVYVQVARWAADQELAWQDSELNDVARYLFRTFYAGNFDRKGEVR